MDLNQTIDAGKGYAGKSLDIVGRISDFVKLKIQELGLQFPDALGYILTIFISLLILYIGLKISQKVIKVLLIICGVLLFIGSIYSIVLRII